MPRIKPLAPAEMDAAQRKFHDHIMAGPRGSMGGPFQAWIHSPDFADRAQKVGEYCRFNSALEPRLSELAILITARQWTAQFEWFAHEPMARKAGVPDDIIQAIQAGEVPDFSDEGDRLSWCIANELHQSHELSEETYAAAVSKFGETGVTELIALSGFYTMVSMTLNGFDVALPEGAALPFDK